VPEVAPGTVVILDNLASHRNKDAERPYVNMTAGSCTCRHIRPT
jgi:hypothetical protein